MQSRSLIALSVLGWSAACGSKVDLGGGKDSPLGAGGDATSSAGGGGAGGTRDGGRLDGTAGAAGSGGAGVPKPPYADGGLGPTKQMDLLLVVDNSPSMGEKQELLRRTVPDLLQQIAEAGIDDLNVGVISSSLGGVGADSCSPNQGASYSATMNDGAHLLTRGPNGLPVPTHQDKGFLAYDPGQLRGGIASAGELVTRLQELVAAVGDDGCGFEQPLEAMRRFLVDPQPYAQVVRVPCFVGDAANGCAAADGVDGALLAQRRAFLRPRSVVAVVVFSDENDCSTIVGGQNFISLQASRGASQFHLPRASTACASDPNDRCCRSCGQAEPLGCPPNSQDRSCGGVGGSSGVVDSGVDTLPPTSGGFYTTESREDEVNVRCFDQKRRFGIEFVHPTSRYVDDLTRIAVPDRAGALVPNPLFEELAAGDLGARGREHVFVLGVVGVPWQAISTAASQASSTTLDYLAPAQLRTDGKWPEIAGDPTRHVPPKLPLMVESIDPRAGALPVTTPTPTAAPNGHERTIAERNDLQAACISPLRVPADCSASALCDCGADDPTCQDPQTGAYGTQQFFMRALPGLRHLDVIRGLGDNGVAASICARNATNVGQPDYAYRPAVRAFVRELKRKIAAN